MMLKLVIIEHDMHEMSLIPIFLSPCVVQTSPALLCSLVLTFSFFLSSPEKCKVEESPVSFLPSSHLVVVLLSTKCEC